MGPRAKLAWMILGTIVLAAGVYLVGNGSTALFDRDEPRYAECSREMLKGSPEHPGPNCVVPRFLGDLRTAKPPGIYWLQSATMKQLGDTVFAARLPSVIGMVLTLAVFSILVWKLAGPSRATWATFILATSVMTMVSAKACLTDAVLLLFVTIAQFCLYAMYRGRGGWRVAITWGVCVGLAGLVKGPVVLAVEGMTLLLLPILHAFTTRPRATVVTTIDPERRFLAALGKTFLGIALVVGIVGPWLRAINAAEPTFLRIILGHDMVDRMKTGLEGHSAPPGYHLLTIWGTFFPWSIFLPMMLVFAFKRRHLPIIRFALATMIGNFIFFECVKTKLPHYLLPIYPWMAIMMADVFVRGLRGAHKDLINGLTRNALTVWGAIVILIGLSPWAFAIIFKPIPILPTLEFSIVLAVVGSLIIYAFRTRRPAAGLVFLGLGSFAMVTVLFGLYLPRVDFLRLSVLVGNDLKALNITGPGQVQMLDYKEPSLAFYQGGTIRECSNNVITQRLMDEPQIPRVLVVTDKVWADSDPAVTAQYEIVSQHRGLAYADAMRRVTVMIIRRKS